MMYQNYLDIYHEYFEWLCNFVVDDEYSNTLSYRKLLEQLYHEKFEYSWDPSLNDENRASDGTDLRLEFSNESSYIYEGYVSEAIYMPCTMLEMMIGLAKRIENQIMSDYSYGDRTGQWFWSMIASLQLGNMDDSNYNPVYVRKRLAIFSNHEYEPNGDGGLFTLSKPPKDLRHEEIWTQAMWYLDENFDFRL